MCTVQTAHDAIQPPDRPATEYLTCAIIPVLCTRSPTPTMIPVADRHATAATWTLWDKQTRFSTWYKDKSKTIETVPDSNWNLTKSMTHHNQIKERTTWFLNLPLDEFIDNEKHKVWSLNPRHHEAQLEDKKSGKAQEGHLD
jgi:hypothetical protein